MSKRKVRGLLIIFGVLATLVFAPLAMLGAQMAAIGFGYVTSDPLAVLGMAVVGFGGIGGIAGAWIRVLVPGAKFKASPTLRRVTASFLAIGSAIAAMMTFAIVHDPLSFIGWLSLPTFVAGVFLLGATIGEKQNAL